MARSDGIGRDYGRVVERLEILTGERGAAGKPQAALRRGDFNPLPPLQSRPVSAAPSQADFNALQADVAALFRLLAHAAKG